MNTLFKLQNIFREVFDDDALMLTPQKGMGDIEGWDSLTQVKIIIMIEREFDINFDEEQIANIRNVAGFIEAIEAKLAGK
jgi:acyl carrier protein